MDFTSDLPLLLSDFGIDATLDGQSVRGILKDRYTPAFDGLMAGEGAYFLCTRSAPVGAALVAAGKTFTVAAIEPDGNGLYRLRIK
jgi:hypothetical protein